MTCLTLANRRLNSEISIPIAVSEREADFLKQLLSRADTWHVSLTNSLSEKPWTEKIIPIVFDSTEQKDPSAN